MLSRVFQGQVAHMPPVPLESLLHLLLCSVQINQSFAMVCFMNQMPDENKRLTFVGFSGRVILLAVVGEGVLGN